MIATPPGDRVDLRARDLTLAYDRRVVVEGLELDIPHGQVTAIVGPNGCGKSTVLRGLSRLLRPAAGQVLLDGRDIHALPTKQVARRLGLLPQSPVVPDGITVAELVGRGRHPHHGLLRQWTREDDEVVARALEQTGTADLADRPVDELSGGQRQRVWIAMVLAQHTDLLLLDEPTSFLDIAHQVEVLDLVRDLCDQQGTTVVMVLHDLAMAARYADHLIAMREGRIVAQGEPQDVVTAETVCDVFGIPCRVRWEEASGDLTVIPLGRHRPPRRVPRPTPAVAPLEEIR